MASFPRVFSIPLHSPPFATFPSLAPRRAAFPVPSRLIASLATFLTNKNAARKTRGFAEGSFVETSSRLRRGVAAAGNQTWPRSQLPLYATRRNGEAPLFDLRFTIPFLEHSRGKIDGPRVVAEDSGLRNTFSALDSWLGLNLKDVCEG